MHYFSIYLSDDVLFGWVFFFFILSRRDLLLSSALGFLLEAMKPGLLWRYSCVAPSKSPFGWWRALGRGVRIPVCSAFALALSSTPVHGGKDGKVHLR